MNRSARGGAISSSCRCQLRLRRRRNSSSRNPASPRGVTREDARGARAQPRSRRLGRRAHGPCAEVIDQVRFPYLGNRDPRYRARLVLDAVSAPPAAIPQSAPTESRPWTHFSKWGLVVRGGGGADLSVTVPPAWRHRVAISWGNAQSRVFHTLRFLAVGRFRARQCVCRWLLPPSRSRLRAASVPGRSGRPRLSGSAPSRSPSGAVDHRRYNVGMLVVAIVLALLACRLAHGGGRRPRRGEGRYLPLPFLYANTPDGAQSRYDAGRELVEAVVAVGPVPEREQELRADLLARPRAGRAGRLSIATPASAAPRRCAACRKRRGLGPRRADSSWPAAAAAAAATANGAVGIWVHDLGTGRYGPPGGDALRAASTVKLGALVAGSARRRGSSEAAGGTTCARSAFWSST